MFVQISKLTKIDFNCLNLVVSIDSWVAVLDFFGIAGDDVPDGEDGPEPQQTGMLYLRWHSQYILICQG